MNLRQLANPKNFFCENMGPVQDKIETLSRFRVSLVIENSNDYFSEKLLDSLFSGTIPVFVGPPIFAGFSDPKIAIQVSPNLESIRAGIDEAQKLDYVSWKENIYEFIKSEVVAKWSEDIVWRDVANRLSERFKGTSRGK
jgi:hypothetical protein